MKSIETINGLRLLLISCLISAYKAIDQPKSVLRRNNNDGESFDFKALDRKLHQFSYDIQSDVERSLIKGSDEKCEESLAQCKAEADFLNAKNVRQFSSIVKRSSPLPFLTPIADYMAKDSSENITFAELSLADFWNDYFESQGITGDWKDNVHSLVAENQADFDVLLDLRDEDVEQDFGFLTILIINLRKNIPGILDTLLTRCITVSPRPTISPAPTTRSPTASPTLSPTKSPTARRLRDANEVDEPVESDTILLALSVLFGGLATLIWTYFVISPIFFFKLRDNPITDGPCAVINNVVDDCTVELLSCQISTKLAREMN